MAMVPDWLLGIGTFLAGAAAFWTVFQQRQLNRHEQRIKDLEDQQ